MEIKYFSKNDKGFSIDDITAKIIKDNKKDNFFFMLDGKKIPLLINYINGEYNSFFTVNGKKYISKDSKLSNLRDKIIDQMKKVGFDNEDKKDNIKIENVNLNEFEINNKKERKINKKIELLIYYFSMIGGKIDLEKGINSILHPENFEESWNNKVKTYNLGKRVEKYLLKSKDETSFATFRKKAWFVNFLNLLDKDKDISIIDFIGVKIIIKLVEKNLKLLENEFFEIVNNIKGDIWPKGLTGYYFVHDDDLKEPFIEDFIENLGKYSKLVGIGLAFLLEEVNAQIDDLFVDLFDKRDKYEIDIKILKKAFNKNKGYYTLDPDIREALKIQQEAMKLTSEINEKQAKILKRKKEYIEKYGKAEEKIINYFEKRFGN